MNVRLKCEKPEDIVYTMIVTMSAKNWEKLRDQLDTVKEFSSYPASDLRRNIDDLLGQARKIFWPVVPQTPQAEP